MSEASVILCPYCGSRQKVGLTCEACGGLFDIASLQATQNDMGAWFVRDSRRPHFVGYSTNAIAAAIRAGELGRDAIVRGPTTRQLWTIARRAAGIAHHFGRCYACQCPVTSEDGLCSACGAQPPECDDRNFLGLPVTQAVPEPIAVRDPVGALEDGFVVDSGIYFVRTTPIVPPRVVEVRVQAPDIEGAPASIAPARAIGAELRVAGLSRTRTPQRDAASAAPSFAAPSPATPASSSPIERSLAMRVRSLERVNRILLLTTVLAFIVGLVLAAAFVVQRDARGKELAQMRRETLAEVEAEFARGQPITQPIPQPIPRPDVPETP